MGTARLSTSLSTACSDAINVVWLGKTDCLALWERGDKSGKTLLNGILRAASRTRPSTVMSLSPYRPFMVFAFRFGLNREKSEHW